MHSRFYQLFGCCLLAVFMSVQALHSQTTDTVPLKKGYIQLSLFHPVGTSWKSSKKKAYNISLNVIYGHVGSVKGVEISPLVNMVERNMYGLQVGTVNLVKRKQVGLQVGLLANVNLQNSAGLQLSGLWTHNQGDFTGWTFSWIGTTTWGNVYGAQLSHIWNHSNKSLYGLQFALGPNSAKENAYGIQMSATMNYAGKEHIGAQFAFLANYAETSEGWQIGLVNIAKKSGGLQTGLINYSGDSSVTAIGLINIVKGGYNKLELWGGELLSFNLALKTGGRKFYSILSAGTNPFNKNVFWAFGWGFGGHLQILPKFYADIDQITSLVNINEFISVKPDRLTLLEQVRFTVGYSVHKKIALFIGPVWNVLISNNNHLADGKNGVELAPTFRTFYGSVGSVQFATWPGLCGGIRFF